MQRPDLRPLPDDVRKYIEFLEAKIQILEAPRAARTAASRSETVEREAPINEEPIAQEAASQYQLLTISQQGVVKRTERHLFSRLHRGGMGVFDLEVQPPDQPAALACLTAAQQFLVFTNHGRVFRFASGKLELTPVRSRGEDIFARIPFEAGEAVAAILPERAQGYVAMVSASGRVRSLRHHLFGEHMKPGVSVLNFQEYGPLASACWTSGDGDIFLATNNGMGIRFNEKLIPPQGDWGIRLAEGAQVVGIAPVYDDSRLFLLGADGRGTVRVMPSFAANKSLGGSGKQTIKNAQVVGIAALERNQDLFVLSRLGKLIRFPANEVSETEGVVQGVLCMSLRGDEVVALLNC